MIQSWFGVMASLLVVLNNQQNQGCIYIHQVIRPSAGSFQALLLFFFRVRNLPTHSVRIKFKLFNLIPIYLHHHIEYLLLQGRGDVLAPGSLTGVTRRSGDGLLGFRMVHFVGESDVAAEFQKPISCRRQNLA